MVDAAKTLAEFSRDFGVPFLLGRRCMIGDPLGRDGLAAIRHGLAVDVDLIEACEEQLVEAALLADVVPAPFDEDAATLLYAVHELFAASHPQATSFYARANLYCRAAEQEVDALPRTLEPGRALTRHLVVERAFSASRTDVHLKWWTGAQSFYGVDPPKRLSAWPSVRRVETQRKTTPMWRIALTGGDEETRMSRTALMTALLECSPLSRLLMLGDPVQKHLGFSLLSQHKVKGRRVSPLDVLEDKALARCVVDAMLARGAESSGAMLALALLQALRESSPPFVLRRAGELCVHLVLAMCIVEAEAPGSKEAAPLRVLLDDGIDAMNEAVRVFWAGAAAVLALDGECFTIPSEHELPVGAGALLARAKARLAHKRVQSVGEPLRRELQRRLPQVGVAEAEDLPA